MCADTCFVLYVELVALLGTDCRKHVCGGICIPQVYADVGNVPWIKYSLAARERAVECSTNNLVKSIVRTAMPVAPHEQFNAAHTYPPMSCMYYSL